MKEISSSIDYKSSILIHMATLHYYLGLKHGPLLKFFGYNKCLIRVAKKSSFKKLLLWLSWEEIDAVSFVFKVLTAY